ncbi:MAG: rod shape-determining protein MreC [Treponema sp.]|jgi:rod shape-determining protein MreC|nr:rod shape-determining protein MreC [Treponema sp.]
MAIKGKKRGGARFGLTSYVFAALVVGSFSLLLFSTRSFVVDIKDMGLSLFSGVRGGIYELGSLVSRTVLSIRELASLRREYAELSGRLARYEQLERTAAEIRQENTRLREQLNFSQSLNYFHIPAEIIGRDPDNLFSALVINKGKYSGVENNMAVIAWQNGVQGLVGKVVQTGQFESLVMPVYDVSSFVSSRFSVSRYDGIVEGQGGADVPLRMRFIRKRARDEISFGDLVVTNGLGGVYPGGVSIGRVNAIYYQDYEISMEVELDSVIDFSRLEYVVVIVKEEQDNG